EHLRQRRANLGAFDRVIVDKHEGVEAEVQGFGQRREITRLRFPVNPMGYDMRGLQDHMGALSEHVQHVRLGVFADQTDESALRLLLNRKPLKTSPTR